MECKFDILTITRSKTDIILNRKYETINYTSFKQLLNDIANSNNEMYIRPHNKETALLSILNQNTLDKKLYVAIHPKIINNVVEQGTVLSITPKGDNNVYKLLGEFIKSDNNMNEMINSMNMNVSVNDLDIFYCTR